MNEDHGLATRKHQIRFAGEGFAVEAVPEPGGMQDAAHAHFGGRVASPDARHVEAALLGSVDVRQTPRIARGDGYNQAIPFTFIDLFAGIGGMRLGFEACGGKCVFTSEWDSYSRKSYAANFPDDRHEFAGDITQVNAEDIPDHDVLVGGFPCQPFSIAGVSKKNALGRPHGFACETQGTLFFDVARIIAAQTPRAFLLENVKNLVSHDKRRTFRVIGSAGRTGVSHFVSGLDGRHFVPQHRERILIAGFREPTGFDWDAVPMPTLRGSRVCGRFCIRKMGPKPIPTVRGIWNRTVRCCGNKLTDKLWNYLQAYAEKHRAKGNGFGCSVFGRDDVGADALGALLQGRFGDSDRGRAGKESTTSDASGVCAADGVSGDVPDSRFGYAGL